MNDKLYSEYFEIESEIFKEYDVFNGFVNRDALYYVLPYKFEDIKIVEFKNSYDKYKQYFSKIITILGNSNGEDRFYREAEKRFHFHELGHLGLGYSKSGKNGSGIGKKFAATLTETAFQLVKAGINDPEIFQLIGLLEEGVGADRISDMTITILKDDFLLYTQRVSLELKLNTKKFQYGNTYHNLPFNTNDEPIIFCPKGVLTDLPVAFDSEDIDRVCSHNNILRDRINQILAEIFDDKAFMKRNFKNLILENPSIIAEIVKAYKNKGKNYNFDNDPSGDFIWKEIAANAIKNHPLSISSKLNLVEVVNKICQQYKDLIEINGLWKFFHNSDGTHKKESFAQCLFFAIAYSYCVANNLDISPESNAGSGPVDFKIGKGFYDKINIEMKLSSNRKLLHGYTTQLPIYNNAEKTNQSKFVIVKLDDKHSNRIQAVYDYKNKHDTLNKKLPDIIVIDATKKESASKRIIN